MKRSGLRTWWAILAVALALTAAAPIASHAYLGTFGRYIADDFCTASTLRRLGFLGSQANWYESWSGRYAYTFVVSLTQAIGPGLTPWLPSLVLLAWVAAILYAAQRLLGPKFAWLLGLVIASIHVFATLEGSPSVYQSLYWQTGMVTYTLPLVLAVAYGGWLWRALGQGRPRSRGWAAAASLVLAFLIGGFSETYVVLQTTALMLLMLCVPWAIARQMRSRAAVVVAAGLMGSLLAGAAIAFAPGTQVRRGLMPAAPGLASWVEAILKDGYLFLARTVKDSPEIILLAVAVPCLLVLLKEIRSGAEPAMGDPSPRGSLVLLVLVPAATPLLILSTIAPYEFAVSSYPDARVLVTPMFVLVTGLVVWGGNLGLLLARQPRLRARPAAWVAVMFMAAMGLILVATAIRSTSGLLGQVEASRAYAQSWDIRDQKLRQAARSEPGLVAAASLRHMGGLAEIGRDPQEWINRCVAGTYGLKAVVAK